MQIFSIYCLMLFIYLFIYFFFFTNLMQISMVERHILQSSVFKIEISVFQIDTSVF